MELSYHTASGVATKHFESMAEFIMLQLREVPALQDHLKVEKLVIDGSEVAFSGTVGELFDQYNK